MGDLGKNDPALKPHHHKTAIHEPHEAGFRAEAWSYLYPRSHHVYVRVLNANGHLVTIFFHVPRP